MKIKTREIALFGMLGAIMYISKMLMEVLPNIHLLDVFIIAFTVLYGIKAIYPVYIFVLITGIFSGFANWWIPYLYIWLVPLLLTLMVRKHLPKSKALKSLILQGIALFCGITFGTFYAPSQALLFNMDFNMTVSWIIAGIPFDLIHGISNFLVGTLIIPVCEGLKRVSKN